jgi:hypothetical protein
MMHGTANADKRFVGGRRPASKWGIDAGPLLGFGFGLSSLVVVKGENSGVRFMV